MVFSSIIFLLYFLPTFILLYVVLPPLRSFVIILGSFVFYAWGEPRYVLLLVLFIVMNWAFGLLQDRRPRARGLLALGIAANLALLLWFKYARFIAEQIQALAGPGTISLPHVALPLGISFFAFQGISYIVDISRGEARAQPKLWKFAMYKAMLPQLIAGPIVRYREIAHEIDDRTIRWNRQQLGIELFVLGLAQKVLIANTVSIPADRIFALPPEMLTAETAWFGAFCYMLQIFFDFAGYTGMAIGLGHMIGFTLPANFNRPYVAQSVTEFWRRWHMTLSRWFRDYLYIPLGGNRRGALRTSINLVAVFALCGLWHGAAWTFLVWGLYHGAFLVAERACRDRLRFLSRPALRPLRHAYLLLVVLLGWVIFRADSLAAAGSMLRAMLGFSAPSPLAPVLQSFTSNSVLWTIAAAILIIPLPSAHRLLAKLHDAGVAAQAKSELPRSAVLATLLSISIIVLSGGTHNPFIYFRF